MLLSLLAGPLLWMSPEVSESYQPALSQGYCPLGFRWALWGPPGWARSQASLTQEQQPGARDRAGGCQPCPVCSYGGEQEASGPLSWIMDGREAPATLELPLPTYPVPGSQHSLGTLSRGASFRPCWVQRNFGCSLVLKQEVCVKQDKRGGKEEGRAQKTP